MATTTTNYGWDIPQSTDLVKDGATAIATLGQDIDTSIYTALGTKKAGLVLLNTTSFSAVSSQALPLNTFTSTYKNYRILWRHTQNTSTGTLTIRMRAAGVNDTGNNYGLGGLYAGVTSAVTRVNSSSLSSWSTSTPTATNIITIVMDILSPQVAAQTLAHMNIHSTSSGDMISVVGQNYNATSYDQLDFITSAGTMTGQVSVYGFNE